MTTSIEELVSLLQETSDPGNAFFSYEADESGECGVIRANKEGLRLYAAEILKRSLEMDKRPGCSHLFFGQHDWIMSDAGYDLISAVRPEYRSRNEILSSRKRTRKRVNLSSNSLSKNKGCTGILVLALFSLLTLAAIIKCFV
jgi:hypothetical protein